VNWFILIVAGLFEIGWAVGLKYTEGFTRFWPTLGTVDSIIISLGLLGIAMKSLPVGTAYAICGQWGPACITAKMCYKYLKKKGKSGTDG